MLNKTVLVTGASGFIVQHSIQSLIDQGCIVHATSRTSSHPAHTGAVWHTVNVLDRVQCTRLIKNIRPDVVLHAAWYTEHGQFWHAAENEVWRIASLHLFQEACHYGAQKLVGVGSCTEYDWHRSPHRPWNESDPCRPHTPYGQAKHALQRSLSEMDIPYVWARLFLMFGFNEHRARLVPSIIQSLLANQPARCTSGQQIRDFMDVRDIGHALATLVLSSDTGVINVASGQAISIATLAQTIGRLMNQPELIHLGALPDRVDDPLYMVANTQKLEHARHTLPEFPSLETRLEENIHWWKTHA